MKKIFIPFIIISIAIFSSINCSYPYDNKIENYKETIISFYTTEDKDRLLILGQKYNYLLSFRSEERGINFLKAQKIVDYKPEDLEISIHIQSDQTLSVNFSLVLDGDNLNEEQKTWLMTHDFYQTLRKDGNNDNLYHGGLSANGKRYESDSNINSSIKKFSKSIKVKVTEAEYFEEPSRKLGLMMEGEMISWENIILYPFMTK